MPTILLQLAGPMQSWGTRSRFDDRDTESEPSKSGVLGLVCAALGIDRHADISTLARLSMGVRIDRAGVLRSDYQTAQDIIAADAKKRHPTAVSRRYYLADAVFLVGLGGGDRDLLEQIDAGLRNPHWPLSLGRKSYVPSKPVFVDNGVVDLPLSEALAAHHPLIEPPPENYRYVLESTDATGSLRIDDPIAPFAERRFAARYVESATAAPGEPPQPPSAARGGAQ